MVKNINQNIIKILFIGDSSMIHFRRMVNYFYDNFNFYVVVLCLNNNQNIRAHKIIVNDCLNKSKKNWLSNNLRLRSIVNKNEINIVNIHYLPSGFTSLFISVPIILTAYGGDINELPTKWISWNKILTKLLLIKSKVVFVDAYDLKKALKKKLNIRHNKIRYFQWGIDLNKFKKDNRKINYRKMFNIPENKKVIISYRGWVDRYNILTLLDAYADLIKIRDDVILVIKNTAIIYDIDYKNVIEKRLSRKDLKGKLIVAPDDLSYDHLLKLLYSSDIYISIPGQDGTAMSLLESIACGAIPLLSDIKPSKEWVKHGENGFLCDITKNDILKNLNFILNTSENRLNRMREHNFRLVAEKANQTKWMNQLNENYLKIYNDGK